MFYYLFGAWTLGSCNLAGCVGVCAIFFFQQVARLIPQHFSCIEASAREEWCETTRLGATGRSREGGRL